MSTLRETDLKGLIDLRDLMCERSEDQHYPQVVRIATEGWACLLELEIRKLERRLSDKRSPLSYIFGMILAFPLALLFMYLAKLFMQWLKSS